METTYSRSENQIAYINANQQKSKIKRILKHHLIVIRMKHVDGRYVWMPRRDEQPEGSRPIERV